VDCGDAFVFGYLGSVAGGLHGGVGAGFEAVGFDIHAAAAAGDGFGAGEICYVDYCIVIGTENMGDCPSIWFVGFFFSH